MNPIIAAGKPVSKGFSLVVPVWTDEVNVIDVFTSFVSVPSVSIASIVSATVRLVVVVPLISFEVAEPVCTDVTGTSLTSTITFPAPFVS